MTKYDNHIRIFAAALFMTPIATHVHCQENNNSIYHSLLKATPRQLLVGSLATLGIIGAVLTKKGPQPLITSAKAAIGLALVSLFDRLHTTQAQLLSSLMLSQQSAAAQHAQLMPSLALTITKKHILRGHIGEIFDARFSSDSDLVVTAGQDRTARIWYVTTGKELKTLWHEQSVTAALFNHSSDKKMIASSDTTPQSYMWRDIFSSLSFLLHTDEPLAISSLAFSPDNSIVAGLAGGNLYLWDPYKVEVKKIFNTAQYTAFSFSPDGQQLLVGTAQGAIQAINLHTLTMQAHYKTATNTPITTLSFGSYADVFVSASDVTAYVWQPERSAAPVVLQGHTEHITTAVMSSDNATVLIASDDGSARVFESATGKNIMILQDYAGLVKNAQFNKQNSLILTNNTQTGARIWDARTGKKLWYVQCNHASFSPDGTKLLTVEKEIGSPNYTATLWDIRIAPHPLSAD